MGTSDWGASSPLPLKLSQLDSLGPIPSGDPSTKLTGLLWGQQPLRLVLGPDFQHGLIFWLPEFL